MSIFKKKKTQSDPFTRYNEAQNRIDSLCEERDELDNDYYWDYDYITQRKKLTRKIAASIHDRNLAEYEIRTLNLYPTP